MPSIRPIVVVECRVVVLNLAFAALLAVSTPQDPSPTVLDDVVVEGVRRDQESSYSFVRAISAPPGGSRTMGVWTRPLCISVDNISREAGGQLARHILDRAKTVGIESARDDCAPNVIIIFSADGAATATDLVRNNRRNLRPTSGPTQLERASLGRFAKDERPVRWWSTNVPVDIESGARTVAFSNEHNPVARNPLNVMPDLLTRQAGVAPPQQTGGPPWRRVDPGLQPVGGSVQEALLLTVVIVDARLINGTPFASLGDYLSMVVLTQVDPEVEVPAFPTILNLFSDSPTATELSRWDLDYLTALYETPVDWSNIRFQQRDIARRMAAAAGPVTQTD